MKLLSLFKVNESKSRKLIVVSALFITSLCAGVVVFNDSLVAQVREIYGENNNEVAGINSLMSAVVSNDINGVRFFSKAGSAAVNQRNFGGATSLLIAARQNNLEIAKILIENGADVNIADNEGWTPLMRASIVKGSELVDLLISKNADATQLNSVGESAIVHAASSDCSSCLNVMFSKFNFVKFMDYESLKQQLSDAYNIARNHDNPEIQSLIEKYLDQVTKLYALNQPKVTDENLRKIEIIPGNELDLITKNQATPQEQFNKNNAISEEVATAKIKQRFRFISLSNDNEKGTEVYETRPNPVAESNLVSAENKNKKSKFVLISPKEDNVTLFNTETAFEKSKSDNSFLENSKVNGEKVVEILKSKKFKFVTGAAFNNESNDLKESTKDLNTTTQNQESSDKYQPALTNFKLIKGPEGYIENKTENKLDLVTKKEQGESNKMITPILDKPTLTKEQKEIIESTTEQKSSDKKVESDQNSVKPKILNDSNLKNVLKFKLLKGPSNSN